MLSRTPSTGHNVRAHATYIFVNLAAMSTLASGRASSASRPAASAISKDLLGAEINFWYKDALKKTRKNPYYLFFL
jgi:hypothetical protein